MSNNTEVNITPTVNGSENSDHQNNLPSLNCTSPSKGSSAKTQYTQNTDFLPTNGIDQETEECNASQNCVTILQKSHNSHSKTSRVVESHDHIASSKENQSGIIESQANYKKDKRMCADQHATSPKHLTGELTVPVFYRGKGILITGATGFIGKVLIEKLLRCCPEVDCLYCLIRPKNKQGIQSRLDEITNSKVIIYKSFFHAITY